MAIPEHVKYRPACSPFFVRVLEKGTLCEEQVTTATCIIPVYCFVLLPICLSTYVSATMHDLLFFPILDVVVYTNCQWMQVLPADYLNFAKLAVGPSIGALQHMTTLPPDVHPAANIQVNKMITAVLTCEPGEVGPAGMMEPNDIVAVRTANRNVSTCFLHFVTVWLYSWKKQHWRDWYVCIWMWLIHGVQSLAWDDRVWYARVDSVSGQRPNFKYKITYLK